MSAAAPTITPRVGIVEQQNLKAIWSEATPPRKTTYCRIRPPDKE